MLKPATLYLATLLALTGCGSDPIQRTAYETLRNLENQACEKDLSRACPPRESYDEYQAKLKPADRGE